MCGIVGVLGQHEVAPVLVEALKRLEYRGYDSAGIATVTDGRITRRRAVGKLANLSDLLVHQPLRGQVGIGHTRWATHGAATEANAHPHTGHGVAVVHNGIIENYRSLSEGLAEQGLVPQSQTDTEIVALLIGAQLAAGLAPADAVAAVLPQLHGAFALCMIFDGYDDLMICARRGSPLVIGHGEGEMFVGSDAIALAPLTDRLTYLDEGDWAVLTRAGAVIHDADGVVVTRVQQRVALDQARIDKAGYRHFMAKEIAEQPVVFDAALSHYLGADGLPQLPLDFSGFDRIVLVACGTASYACHIAKYWFEQIARIPAEIDVASEFRYRAPVLSPRSLAIFVSQSGETADTLAALRHVRGQVAQVAAVVNVPTSSIAREADIALPIFAGVEVGVASTKAFTCQLSVLAAMALQAALQRGAQSADEIAALAADLRLVPGLINASLTGLEAIAPIARQLAQARDVLFLGRGAMYPLALEAALKLKEISYIHAEAYASGELKHGPIALIDADVPVVVMAPRDALFDKTVSNMQEVMARHGKVLLISDAEGIAEAGAGVWHSLAMPSVAPVWAPILYAIPAQLLAYHTAIAKGTDVDQPRNLAKSVTVE
ncbi:glutamine--fructose-6-phosphate transaminase (isomerizing) [Ketogulonicigenium vulgare]|uniref:Glutamine--fructose-6-phosphate aminotransferase [isomerizing] n=1 Tax=Ketogulonicigenium vulgare (strain WSH-001) TaxID=759362 RepID=F9Y7X1_KETVW|nr:glutamine--fructose-6-phosphate transaminase (isomerizing) [Ketogulonicigenium vulgare]ADO42910.1 glucosamine--fructose-6-phosphate aminotransferase [Ketogulonicigenium vulgare Y25]AEM41097.1 Glucosamine--fructose-6-phosphate aminotransferase, isomerizing [Ketogulonicigenium vulgare WSH-001]ALJ81237.1 glucosamine--fructose-6-phosphate aminotransferase [Ketogulonicigenium vulgare]ANW33979.1 glutamine--fructose-6-phosphate aminotransferase [Ketogulonicigenium vulgare]AOZ54820.1 glucosamine--f